MDSTFLLNVVNPIQPTFRSSVESIVSKNDRMRYYNLMNNEGAYSLYEEVTFPTIGMLYDPYGRFFNRPVTRYGKTGIIEYYNAINENDIESVNEHFHLVNDFGGNVKDVYVTNRGHVTGGEVTLDRVKQEINAYLAQKKYVSEQDVIWLRDYKRIGQNLKLPHVERTEDTHTVDRKAGVTVQMSYTEDADYLNTRNSDVERDYTYDNNYETFISQYDSNGALSWNNDLSDVGGYSLLDYTNRLFATGKIGSLIDRYQTGDGQSRGRALLKKGMEPNSGTDGDTDGYKNPFCRVWTKTHQYRKMTDLIRPRVEGSGDGKRFYTLEEIQGEYGDGWRPFQGNKRLDRMSVLQKNGMVNMTPLYYGDDTAVLDKDSIKKCMFSIENLAWRDIIADKPANTVASRVEAGGPGYVLTEEQRGPNGGRIMWFPPYNLSFSEQINPQWQDYSFIGRGEKIYTYTNTERTGTLSFTLLIDHPSVLDQYSVAHNSDNQTRKEIFEQEILRFFAGCTDVATGLDLKGGTGTDDKVKDPDENKVEAKPTSKPKNSPLLDEDKAIKFFVFFPNNFSGKDYQWSGVNPGGSGRLSFTDILYGSKLTKNGWGYESSQGTNMELLKPMVGKVGQKWYYIVDNDKVNQVLAYPDMEGPNYNYKDLRSFQLNYSTENVRGLCNGFNPDHLYAFQDVVACTDEWNGGGTRMTERQKQLKNIFEGNSIAKITVQGHASSTGNNPDENRNIARNSGLARDRAQSVAWWMKEALKDKGQDVDVEVIETTTILVDKQDVNYNSKLATKQARSAEVTIYFKTDETPENTTDNSAITEDIRRDEEPSNPNLYSKKVAYDGENKFTYDDEFRYFKHLKESDVNSYDRIIDKVKYFTPAFHSITPEGFNARLTFLQQCTRQGPSATENSGSVGNLAFGRPPYCVLRIGDFFNTKIVIDSIQINYDNNGVMWDLNPEGVGVQPMYATVNMSFKFIGGTDISGPINKLQNAVSFNYYSNTSIYDRRADYRANFIANDADKSEYGDKLGDNELSEWESQSPVYNTKNKE